MFLFAFVNYILLLPTDDPLCNVATSGWLFCILRSDGHLHNLYISRHFYNTTLHGHIESSFYTILVGLDRITF